MARKQIAKRSRLSQTWEPATGDIAFARDNGIEPECEGPRFRDYHLSKGSLMADWPAAWRTWVRNAVRYLERKGEKPGLLAAIDAADAYGAHAWAHNLPDARGDTMAGEPVLGLCGYPIIEVAREICAAAGWDQDHRGDLDPIAQALRSGCDPEMMVDVVRTARRPDRPTLRYYAVIWEGQREKRA